MFIAIEGIDGTGKTTISRMLYEKLKENGVAAYLTKEPTENLVLDYSRQSDRSPENGISLFFRFTEDRLLHQKIIAEKVREGFLVVTDRYLLSSYAYQGALIEPLFENRETSIRWMKSVSEIINVLPDLTFYLDLDVEQAMRRMTANRKGLTGFEEKKYLSSVRDYYENFLDGNALRIDASRSPETVTDEIYRKIMENM